MIRRNLMIPGIQWSKGNEWTLKIQKSTVIPPSPMILFNIFKRILHKAIFGQWAIFIRLVLSKKLKHLPFCLACHPYTAKHSKAPLTPNSQCKCCVILQKMSANKSIAPIGHLYRSLTCTSENMIVHMYFLNMIFHILSSDIRFMKASVSNEDCKSYSHD